MAKKLGLSEAQLAASGVLPQQQDIMGDVTVKTTRKPRKNTKVVVLDTPDQVVSYVENHEPGQPLPEDAAERAANGSGWQGEEVTLTEEEAQELQERQQWDAINKSIAPDLVHENPATEEFLEAKSAKQQKTKQQAAKPKTVAKPKVQKPAAEKKAKVQLLAKGEKTPVTGSRVVEVGGKKMTIHGYTLMTADIVWTIVQRGEEATKKGEKLSPADKKAFAEELNIAYPNIGDVLNGQPWAVKMLAKKGYTHPHPRNENGLRVGVKHVKDTEAETINGTTYHKGSE
jgi:hypothetical protein